MKKPKRPYHHGNVPAAMLAASLKLIRKHGPHGFSVREAADAVGVSHAAPAYHFGGRKGLLTALAVQGFDRLVSRIEAEIADSRPRTGPARLEAVGRGYIAFAAEDPERFSVMFQSSLLNERDKALTEASDRAYAQLTGAIGAATQERRVTAARAGITGLAAWSLVHGFAQLWGGGRLAARIGRKDHAKLAQDLCAWFSQAAF